MKLEELKYEVLAEMANIHPEEHKSKINIKFHVLQPGTWNHSGHGPRIKLFKGDFKSSLKSIILLDQDPNRIKVLKSSFNLKLIKRSEVNDLIIYFKKYRYAYLIMWLDVGIGNMDLMDLMKETDKNPNLVKQKFEILYNKL
jgi:hypothetical protein